MTGLFVILYSTDFLMFIIAAEHTMTNGIGGMVLFASEVVWRLLLLFVHMLISHPSPQYAVLMASVLNTIAKYILSAIELRRAGSRGGENAPPWENKSMWVFYIELITGISPGFLLVSIY
jgi:E3 ubiquitin-protein ligase synoviolin